MAKRAPADIRDYLKLLERAPESYRRSWDAIAIYDLEGRVVQGNAAARALLGNEWAASLQGRHFTAHLTLEAATKAARDFAQCVTAGQVVESESVFVDGAGHPIPVRTRLVPARVDGELVGVMGFARDVRDRLDVQAQFVRSQQQFRSLFENHPDGLALQDLQGRFVRVNAAIERITGYTTDELIGQTPALFVVDPPFDAKAIRASMERREVERIELTIRTKNGDVREIDGLRVPLDAEGRIRGWCGIIRDVTDERRAARSSARQATRIAELYRIASAPGGSTTDKASAALEAGVAELGADWSAVVRVAGESAVVAHTSGEGVIALPDGVLRSPAEAADVWVSDDPAATPRSIAAAPFSIDGRRYGVVVFARNTGPFALSAVDRDYLRALAVLIGSAMQESERMKRLDSLAFGDALTGLPNRALLQDRLEQTLLTARRHRRSFAAHYVDIDHFKTINDTYGHAVGDAVLVAVSGWFRSVLRDSDTVGRFGGDEFVVLQSEIDSQKQAEELAAKLCGIHDRPFRIGAREIPITVSVGCAVFPVDAENPVDMLKAADAALYEVKHRGRDGYLVGTVE